jgi:hypothetical protein
MLRRRHLLVLTVFGISACDSGPVSPPRTSVDADAPQNVLIDGTTTGNSNFHVLPPLVRAMPSIDGDFDPTLRPRVEICEWSVAAQACVSGGSAFSYTLTSGPEGEAIRVSRRHYAVNWDTGLEGVDPGKVFRATVFLVNIPLGSVDIEIGRTGRDVRNINTGQNLGLVDGRTLPFRFSIGEGAVTEEEEEAEAECINSSGEVIDCDVEVVAGEEGGSVIVVQAPETPDETLAGIVTINADDVVDENGDPVEDFVLTLEHVTPEPAPVEDIPLDQQIPFFLEATAVDENGDPVFFEVGAELTICQAPDLGDPGAALYIPDELHHFLKIYQVSDGTTEILPTTLDNQANCPGGLHGGLNTTRIRRFSGFGAVLPTLPSASTATVPNGVVGAGTMIDIQAQLDASHDQMFGGDEVVVTVTGANSASPLVVDNDDGTYSTQYTPSSAGTDQVAIQIRNVETGSLEHISGSPFTSVVSASTLSHSITVDDPMGDHTGLTDVRSMELRFDPASGDYTITLIADPLAMFQGSLRINVNLYNPEAGTFFTRTFVDLTFATPESVVVLQGTSPALTAWETGQEVYTNSLAGTPNPSGVTLFRSSVWHLTIGEDVIAFSDLSVPAIVVGPTPPAQPFLSISDVTVSEGDAGTTNAVFTVTLSAASASTVSVDWTTSNGTATAPGDYAADSGVLAFDPGDPLTQTITIQVVGDTVSEAAIKSFNVVLSLPVNATIADANGLGSIIDDDGIG